MIVSYKHKFIFIKTTKTAGTSTEILLSGYCGPEDVITPLGFGDEKLRREGGRRGAQNFTEDTALAAELEAAFQRGDETEYRRLFNSLRNNDSFCNHMSARRAVKKIDPDFWASAFKFTIERHPYERAVSAAYFWLARRGMPESEFPRMLDLAVKHYKPERRRYAINGKTAVDFVIRYENLRADLDEVLGRLGLPLQDDMPRAKGAFRTDRRPANEILSDEQKKAIYDKASRTFEAFNYER